MPANASSFSAQPNSDSFEKLANRMTEGNGPARKQSGEARGGDAAPGLMDPPHSRQPPGRPSVDIKPADFEVRHAAPHGLLTVSFFATSQNSSRAMFC